MVYRHFSIIKRQIIKKNYQNIFFKYLKNKKLYIYIYNFYNLSPNIL